MHFEKTAGTSIHKALSRYFEPREIFPERSEAIRFWPSETLDRFKFFTLHASVREIACVPAPFTAITFLRDPVARLISLYRYWTSFRASAIEAGNLYLPRFTKPLTFEEFVSEKSVNIIPSLWNQYTQYLAGDRMFAPSGQPWRSENEIVQAALSNLDRFAFVGLVEDMSSSLDRMAQALDLDFSQQLEWHNTTDGNRILDPVTYEEPSGIHLTRLACDRLHEITRLDQIIYRHAQRMHGNVASRRQLYSMMHGRSANITESTDGIWLNNLAKGSHATFGPFVPLAAGRYEASFKMRLNGDVPKHLKIGALEVARRGGEIIARRVVRGSDVRTEPTTLVLPFYLNRFEADIEFRSITHPDRPLLVNQQVMLIYS